jgi:predicted nucleic-acid-binding Zn-ribbon protein
MVETGRLVAHTRVLAGVSLAKKGDVIGDRIIPHYCRNCGYIEFYKEMKPDEQSREQGFLRKCVKCGKQIPIASEECQHCGAEQKRKNE